MDEIIERSFSDFLRENQHPDVKELDWKDAQELLTSQPQESNAVQEEKLADYLSAIRLSVLSIGSLAIAAWSEVDENKILRSDFDAKDLYLGTWLTNIANTASSILRLCLDGFDTQAKSLLRNLHERTKQLIILFYSDSDYKTWHEAFDAEDARAIHYSLFSRRGRINKRYNEIENELGHNISADVQKERKDDEIYYSQAVHGSSDAILIGSFGFEYGSEKVFPSVFGYPSSSSKGTVTRVFWDLLYFQMLLNRLLEKVHTWNENNGCQYSFYYRAYREAFYAVARVLTKEDSEQGAAHNAGKPAS